jgi:Uma2 family endonuclease
MPAPRITQDEYFRMPESLLPQELVDGVVRDAAAPTSGHQWIVGALYWELRRTVQAAGAARIYLSPIDVVLDDALELVVQPDLIAVCPERFAIVRDRVNGAPDLVIEVLSPAPRIGTLQERIEWFARSGVRECWLVHQFRREIEVVQFDKGAVTGRRSFGDTVAIESRVFPELTLKVMDIFR